MIFSVRVLSEPGGRKSAQPVEIFFNLHPDGRGRAAVAALAADQRRLIELGQLQAAGITRGRLRTLRADSTLQLVLPRVYALGTYELPRFGSETAALLHLRHDAVISHASAAALWGLVPEPDGVRATIIGRGLRPRDGLRLHRVAALDSRDVRLLQRLPVTAPARTLIDYAADARPAELTDAAAEARARRLVTDEEFDAALVRAPLRSGVAVVRALRATPVGRLLTRSWLERQLLALLADAGLPLPVMNTRVNGHEVDAYWPQQRLILELDGWTYHGGRRAFESDHARDQDHAAAGDRTMRITYTQLVQEPLRTAAKIAAALAVGP